MLSTQVQSLGWEDPLEEEVSAHSSILAWKIPWTEEPGGLQFIESEKSWTRLSTHTQAYAYACSLPWSLGPVTAYDSVFAHTHAHTHTVFPGLWDL